MPMHYYNRLLFHTLLPLRNCLAAGQQLCCAPFFEAQPVTLAIFDLDNTLIGGDSDNLWGQFLCDEGLVDSEGFAQRNDQFYRDYQRGELDIFAYLRCVEQDEFLAIQEDLFLRMADVVQKAGSGFAFPSQTTYLARDSGLDAERTDKAETEVKHRRFTGKLPFPEFEGEERERLEDSLDYPPKGSPHYGPRGE